MSLWSTARGPPGARRPGRQRPAPALPGSSPPPGGSGGASTPKPPCSRSTPASARLRRGRRLPGVLRHRRLMFEVPRPTRGWRTRPRCWSCSERPGRRRAAGRHRRGSPAPRPPVPVRRRPAAATSRCTSRAGATRVYARGERTFVARAGEDGVRDSAGRALDRHTGGAGGRGRGTPEHRPDAPRLLVRMARAVSGHDPAPVGDTAGPHHG